MTGSDHDGGGGHEPDPARIVADADVLAADLLVGGAAREALDHVRRHDWLDLVATEPLLGDAESVVETLADGALAADWRRTLDEMAVVVEQPTGDHPALAAAYRGNAAHVLSLDDRLLSPQAGANLRGRMAVSVRSPDAFATVFDPAAAYEQRFEASYPGPDADPRE
jgi:predicted nucleic acid-binding protein